MNFGPQHPAAHGVLRLVLELDGEVVERADPHIGLLHRGTEKLIEYRPYIQSVGYFDRLDYVSMMCQEHAYVLAIENLLGIEIPERAKYIRVLYSEITRILNHLLNVTTMALDIGAMTPLLWGFEEREKLMEFYERVSGARMHANYFRPGGVRARPAGRPARGHRGLDARPSPRCSTTSSACSTTTGSSASAPSTSAWSPPTRRSTYGFTGPMLRASGLRLGPAQEPALRGLRPDGLRHPGRPPRRLLRSLPGAHGRDARVAEDHGASASSRCRTGRSSIQDHKITPPTRGELKRSMEALIHHFKLYTEGFHVPAGETYAAVEAPKGEFGVYLVADGTNRPYRCKIRATSYPASRRAREDGQGAHAAGHPGDHRLDRHRVRGDRPVSERARRPFAFTPENEAKAEADRRALSGGPPGERGAARC